MSISTAFSGKFKKLWDNNSILVFMILIYLIFEIPKQITGLNSFRTIQALFMTVVVFGHGVKRYGWGAVLFLLLITFSISWTAESISIISGFPFGKYEYTENLGTKIGAVPWGIMPAYFLTAYLSWSLGASFLNNHTTGIRKKDIILIPCLASFIMVMWNFCFDPIHSTVLESWIWKSGGPFWGVPLSNYLGWFITVYIIFQIFAIYLYREAKDEPTNQNRVFWFIPPIMYLGIALEFILDPFFKTGNKNIYWSMFLGTIFTMVFTGLLNIIQLSRKEL
ncbi:MAG: carotenoid biosynthesis protein [Spirochaetales bacterium]|nr:carotenoid biosynthesis protein [Spirochaetales bacterium]